MDMEVNLEHRKSLSSLGSTDQLHGLLTMQDEGRVADPHLSFLLTSLETIVWKRTHRNGYSF